MKSAIEILWVVFHPASNQNTLWSWQFFSVEIQPGLEEKANVKYVPLVMFLFQKNNLPIKGDCLRNTDSQSGEMCCVSYGSYRHGLLIIFPHMLLLTLREELENQI